MVRLIKCRGVIGNRDIVNCPLAKSCLRHTITSIGFKQEFMLTPIKEKNEQCKMFITNKEND